MIVSELEDLLALLPADMTVCVEAGEACRHINRVDKVRRRLRSPADIEAGMAALGPVRAVIDGRYPAQLVLRASSAAPMWWAAFGDEVPFTVDGHWPAKRQPR